MTNNDLRELFNQILAMGLDPNEAMVVTEMALGVIEAITARRGLVRLLSHWDMDKQYKFN